MASRRPHMKLRVGEQHHVIGYHHTGSGWTVYQIVDDYQTDSDYYPTAERAHRAWLEACLRVLRATESDVAPEPDVSGEVEHFISEDG